MGLDPLQFTETPSDDLICGICLDVFEECWKTNCNHRYCHYCLQLLLTLQEPECSFCRERIKYKECSVDVDMNRKVKALNKTCHTCQKTFQFGKEHQHICKIPLPTTEKDVWVNVLSYLDAKSLCKIQSVNKTLSRMSLFGRLWRKLYILDLNQPVDTEFNRFGEWKQYYKVKFLEMNRRIISRDNFDKDPPLNETIEDIQMKLALELSLKENQKPNYVSFDEDEYVVEIDEDHEDTDPLEKRIFMSYTTNFKMY